MRGSADSGEAAAIARRHAEHCRDLLEAAQTDWDSLARESWLGLHGAAMNDVRAALQWTFGDGGTGTGKELFDVRNDPAEKKNLVDEHADVADKLQARLSQWQKSVLNSLSGADYSK